MSRLRCDIWPRFFGPVDSGMTAVFFHNNRSVSDKTTETQPLAGLQDESGFGSLEGKKTLIQLAAHYDVHANHITSGKTLLLENAAGISGPGWRRAGHEG